MKSFSRRALCQPPGDFVVSSKNARTTIAPLALACL
jgi:hypothetical protein